jgi:adenine-specific DNA-methyltransferase
MAVRGFVPTPPNLVDFMIGRLFRGRPPNASDTLLDPGCGTGPFIDGVLRWCRATANEIPQVTGVELEPDRATLARDRFRSHPQVRVRQGDFLDWGHEQRFDFVIGNPPYVSILGLSKTEKNDFRSCFETARGRFDLYLLFFERALKSLKESGRLVFVTPEKFLYVETAAPLRRLLSRFQVEEIWLEDELLFDGRVSYPTITTVSNRTSESRTLIHLRDGSQHLVTLTCSGESWMPLVHGADLGKSRKATLKDICLRISCGVATGADDVFVRPTSSLEPGLSSFAKPTIAGRELNEPGEIPKTKYSILVPYTALGRLMDERDLFALGIYLRKPWNRNRLLQRTCVRRKPWYSFHETPPLRDILRPKILCKDITRRPEFWIDHAGNLVPRHSVYYIVPRDPSILDRLCEYLRSEKVSNWLAEHCQRAANGFLRLQSSVLKALPIPEGLRIASSTNLARKERLIPGRKQSGFDFAQAPR